MLAKNWSYSLLAFNLYLTRISFRVFSKRLFLKIVIAKDTAITKLETKKVPKIILKYSPQYRIKLGLSLSPGRTKSINISGSPKAQTAYQEREFIILFREKTA